MSDIPDRIHKRLIETVVKGLAEKPLVLKGGTALILAYNLDRYSEDIDYDSNTRVELTDALEKIMRATRMEYNIVTKTHTATTSRSIIHYSTGRVKDQILKVEIKNNLRISFDEVNKAHGFSVYSINTLCRGKLRTTSKRIKPRDFYDLGYIAKRFKSELDDKNLYGLQDLSQQKTLHDLYRQWWSEDDFVKDKPFQVTVSSLSTVEKYLQNKHEDNKYGFER